MSFDLLTGSCGRDINSYVKRNKSSEATSFGFSPSTADWLSRSKNGWSKYGATRYWKRLMSYYQVSHLFRGRTFFSNAYYNMLYDNSDASYFFITTEYLLGRRIVVGWFFGFHTCVFGQSIGTCFLPRRRSCEFKLVD
jgi:hypothetical protein